MSEIKEIQWFLEIHHIKTYFANKKISVTWKNIWIMKINTVGLYKWLVVHPYSGVLLSNQKDWILICKNMQESQNIMLSDRSQTHKAACFVIPLTWHFQKGKTGLWLPGFGSRGGGLPRSRKELCLGDGNILHLKLHAFVKTQNNIISYLKRWISYIYTYINSTSKSETFKKNIVSCTWTQ